MDSSSWTHGNGVGSGDFMCGYGASCRPAGLEYREQEKEQQQQHHELLVSSEIQQHLNQISMELNIDDAEAAGEYSQRCTSVVDDFDLRTNSYHATGGCSFPSTLSCSPEISSSFQPAPEGVVLLPYDDDTVAAMAPGGISSTSAFRRYDRQLGPRKRLTKSACGQRMFKMAMAVLGNMHTVMRYKHHQQEPAAEPSGNQLQHLIAERKRREKLNDSFLALKTILPLVSKPKLVSGAKWEDEAVRDAVTKAMHDEHE